MSEMPTRSRLRGMTADEAAALWLLAREDDALAEVDLFEEWHDQSEANQAAWRRVNVAWSRFDSWAEDELLSAARAAALEAKPQERRIWPWAAASAVAIAACVSMLTFGWLETWTFTPSAPGAAPVGSLASLGRSDFATAVGQRSKVDLPDGSTLSLDTDSAVDIAFAGNQRRVRLVRGQALFAVAPDKSRPFSVEAGGRTVTALGTRFNVRMDDTGVRVVLIEGRVVVDSPADAPAYLELRPGEQFLSRDGFGAVSRADVGSVQAWEEGFVEFKDAPLQEAAAEMNRYNERQLIVRDPKVVDYRISGRFRAGDPDRFSRVLAQIHPVRVVARRDGNLEVVAARR